MLRGGAPMSDDRCRALPRTPATGERSSAEAQRWPRERLLGCSSSTACSSTEPPGAGPQRRTPLRLRGPGLGGQRHRVGLPATPTAGADAGTTGRAPMVQRREPVRCHPRPDQPEADARRTRRALVDRTGALAGAGHRRRDAEGALRRRHRGVPRAVARNVRTGHVAPGHAVARCGGQRLQPELVGTDRRAVGSRRPRAGRCGAARALRWLQTKLRCGLAIHLPYLGPCERRDSFCRVGRVCGRRLAGRKLAHATSRSGSREQIVDGPCLG